LILRPHAIAVTGRLSNHLPFRLTIYPALPGSNSLRVGFPGNSRPDAQLTVVAGMTGMAMTPSRARLANHGHTFVGWINLPMFGRYRLTVNSQLESVRHTDHVTVVLPLP
jgi:hypothetical protein